jgi:hypothetical protein
MSLIILFNTLPVFLSVLIEPFQTTQQLFPSTEQQVVNLQQFNLFRREIQNIRLGTAVTISAPKQQIFFHITCSTHYG